MPSTGPGGLVASRHGCDTGAGRASAWQRLRGSTISKFQILVIGIGAIMLAIVAAKMAFPLPALTDRIPGVAAGRASAGPLAGPIARLAGEHPGSSGVFLLPQGDVAFAARILMARNATATIDVQYYIWHDDLTGLLLLDELRGAADRGVAVRLLLDDNGIDGLDPVLAELDAHPGIEVRLYNPFTLRRFKRAGYAFDFFRLNHRMHNKSFTVDGVATIGGGRNIGDEYFGTAEVSNYVDLDALVIGTVVDDVSDDFAGYWNSRSAYPLATLVERHDMTRPALRPALDRVADDPRLPGYRSRIEDNETVSRMVDGTLPFEWASTVLVSDPPDKTMGRAADAHILAGQITRLLGRIEGRLDVVSPYFVPGERGAAHLAQLARSGVRVRVLTNAQEATDVLPVHAGYAKYRKRLLAAGVELYELKAENAPASKRSDNGIVGSSSASLHAKTFAVDRRRTYVGSFNFDPRSVTLNTEMGFLIESTRIADDIHDRFAAEIGDTAYALSLDRDGKIVWRERTAAGSEAIHRHDPNTTRVSRAAVTVIGWLPVQWLL